MTDPNPTLLISWAHTHQSWDAALATAWRAQILDLANALRQSGVDADLDLYHQTEMAVDWTRWGPRRIEECDFVAIAVSEAWRERWAGVNDPTQGAGAAAEANALKGVFARDQAEFQRKAFIVVLPGARADDVPTDLNNLQRLHLTSTAPPEIEKIIRLVTNQSSIYRRPLGQLPVLPAVEGTAQPSKDPPARTHTSDARAVEAGGDAGPTFGAPIIVGTIVSVDDRFQDRTALSTILVESLHSGRRVVLSGQHGSGKTQLSARYIQDRMLGEHRPDILIWIDGSDPDAALLTYARAELVLLGHQSTSLKEGAEAVKIFLEGTSRAWIAVADNVLSLGDIGGLPRPGANGSVILTTNLDPAVFTGLENSVVIEVAGFSSEESRTYLNNRLPEQGASDWEILARTVSGLPLLLEMSASYIQHNKLALAEYMALFEDQSIPLGDLLVGPQTPANSIDPYERIWNRSVLEADLLAPTGAASTILALLAGLPSKGAPPDILISEFTGIVLPIVRDGLHSASSGGSPPLESSRPLRTDQVRAAIANLRRYSLVSWEGQGSGGRISLHPIFRRVLTDRLRASVDLLFVEVMARTMVATLARVVGPSDDLNTFASESAFHFLRTIPLETDLGDSVTGFTILAELGDVLIMRSPIHSATFWLELIREIPKSDAATEREYRRRALEGLALSLSASGQWPQAADTWGDLTSLYVDSGDRRQQLLARINWALNLAKSDHVHDAAKELQTAEQMIAVLGANLLEKHETSLVAIVRAEIFSRSGRARDAVEIMRSLVSDFPVVDDPLIADSLEGNLGVYLGESGEHQQASQILQSVYDRRRESWGVNHPATITALKSLGDFEVRMGDTKSGRKKLRQVLRSRTASRGDSHARTLAAYVSIGDSYFKEANYLKAIACYRIVFRNRVGLAELEEMDLINYNALGLSLQFTGAYAACVPLFEAVFEVRERSPLISRPTARLAGEVPLDLVHVNNLALAYEDCGFYARAVRMLTELIRRYGARDAAYSNPAKMARRHLAYCEGQLPESKTYVRLPASNLAF